MIGKTPYEAYHGKKPNVGHLLVFGCTAYAHMNDVRFNESKVGYEEVKCTSQGLF